MRPRVLIPLLACIVALVLVHLYLAGQPQTAASPLAPLDRLFDICFTAALGFASLGVGRSFLNWLSWEGKSSLEELVFGFAVGAGTLGLSVFGLGIAHILYPQLVLIFLLILLLLTFRVWAESLENIANEISRCSPLSRIEALLLAGLAAIVLPVMAASLLPPTGSDGLGYHLVAPAFFLSQHSLFASFDNIGLNYPINMDMLSAFGLAAGSDIAAQMVHFLFGLVLTVGIYSLASHYLSRSAGILAAVIFWTSSVIGLVASAPQLDLGWALYEFLAVYSFLRWRESQSQRDLFVLGAMIGFALANKYLALFGLGILGLGVGLVTISTMPRNPIFGVRNLVVLTGIALAVSLPWYLKNAIWLGNPVYPFFLGSYGLDGQLGAGSGDPASWVAMGTGHDLKSLLLFPYNVYVNWQNFGPGTNRAGPSLFFLLLPLYVLIPKTSTVNWLLTFCGLRFAAWWPFTQNIHYLVVVLPWLCVASAYVAISLAQRIRRPSLRLGLVSTTTIFFLAGLILEWGFLLVLRADSISFLFGQTSRDSYLSSNLLDYQSISFMNENLPPAARIFAIGDARVYYLERTVLEDQSHDNWWVIAKKESTPDGIAARLHSLGVTHVWVSEDDLKLALNFWKIATPLGDETFSVFRSRYLNQIYADTQGNSVYAWRSITTP